MVPESLRLGVCLAMLLGAAVLDLRSRRVGNRYWIPFVAVAAFLVVTDAAGMEGGVFLWRAGAAAITCGVVYAAWFFGTFGGADAKGLMVLAWLWPGLPDLDRGTITPAVDALVNATALMLLLPVAFLLINTLRGRVRLPAMLLGTSLPLATAQARHVWPMQRMEEGRLVWRYWQRPGEDLASTYHDLERAGVQAVWVTPKVPFMAVLPFGLLLHAVHGNILFGVVAGLSGA